MARVGEGLASKAVHAWHQVLALVCCRGHHQDVGGITPGSMPPNSRSLTEEGAAIIAFKLVRGGKFQVGLGLTTLSPWAACCCSALHSLAVSQAEAFLQRLPGPCNRCSPRACAPAGGGHKGAADGASQAEGPDTWDLWD